MREDACQCVAVRAMPRLSRTATNSSRTAHVVFTNSSRHVHELVRVAAWPCLPTDTVTCTSRIDGTSSSRLVYALHEQFAHGTSSSRRVHEQFTTTARQWRSRRRRGIYRASWTLLAIPEIASEETTYITETTCLKQSRHEEEQSREGQKPTGQRQRR